MLTFIDDYLSKDWIYTLKSKLQTFVTFKWWKARVDE